MLGVIFIISLLMGILYPTIAKVRTKGKMAKAQAEIEALAVALRMYESDLGKYPPSTTAESDALHKYLGIAVTSTALNIVVGPYMEFKIKDLSASNQYKDPWGNAYVYAAPGTNNTNSFDIHSLGPDGSDNTADDVKNW